MDILLALLAAVAFATGNVLQQKGTLQTPAGGDDPRFLVQILRRPVWLAGGLMQVTGWVLQAAALDRGPLVAVQSVTMLSLVIALPLGARITGQHVGQRELLGALAVVVGITLFLSVGSPSGGTTNASAGTWWAAGLTSLLIVGTVATIGRRHKGAARAVLFGSGAGVAFGLQAAVTKVFVGQLGNGVLALLGSWSIYVLIVSALVGFALMQSALKTGVLAASIASSNAMTLFASVILGIWVFDESLGRGGGHLIPAVLGLVVALAGISRLSTAPGPTGVPEPA